MGRPTRSTASMAASRPEKSLITPRTIPLSFILRILGPEHRRKLDNLNITQCCLPMVTGWSGQLADLARSDQPWTVVRAVVGLCP